MDKVNSLRLYPNHLEMIGDPIGIRIKEPLAKFYKTKVSRFEHVPDDPLFDCDVYSVDNSYNNCIQDELLGLGLEIKSESATKSSMFQLKKT